MRRALGVHVNDLVAETLEDARAALAHLTQGGHGRARILVLNRLPQGAGPQPHWASFLVKQYPADVPSFA